MSSRLESPESAPDDLVDATRLTTRERIGGTIGNIIGFTGAVAGIGGYVVARTASEAARVAGDIWDGFQRKDYGNNATAA